VITGGINVVIQFFKNLGLSVANIAIGIYNAIAALASNMQTAFHNSICNIQAWFYNLLSTAASVIAGIAQALNQLPFVSFDYSGITSAANDYASKAAAAEASKESYTDVGAAFSKGLSTYNTFQSGWASDAFKSGAAWGDGVAGKISNLVSSFNTDTGALSDYDFSGAVADGIGSSGLGDSSGSTAGSASDIASSVDKSSEDLKYLRDIAEQETVNRYTLASVSVDMSGMTNHVNNGMDLDGVVSGLTDAVNEAIESMTEGVHD
jgi:lysozyme family protein